MTLITSKKFHGFTLIELLVTLSIAGVLLAYAIPSYRDFSVRKSLSNETNNLISDLNYARITAINKGALITVVSIGGSPNWENGWNISLILPGGDLQTLRSKQNTPGSITMTAVPGIGTITYNSLGALTTAPLTINVQDAPGYPNFISLSVLASGMATSNRSL